MTNGKECLNILWNLRRIKFLFYYYKWKNVVASDQKTECC